MMLPFGSTYVAEHERTSLRSIVQRMFARPIGRVVRRLLKSRCEMTSRSPALTPFFPSSTHLKEVWTLVIRIVPGPVAAAACDVASTVAAATASEPPSTDRFTADNLLS